MKRQSGKLPVLLSPAAPVVTGPAQGSEGPKPVDADGESRLNIFAKRPPRREDQAGRARAPTRRPLVEGARAALAGGAGRYGLWGLGGRGRSRRAAGANQCAQRDGPSLAVR